MDDMRDFIIDIAGCSFRIGSYRLEDDQLAFNTIVTREGEKHRLEVTIREQPRI